MTFIFRIFKKMSLCIQEKQTIWSQNLQGAKIILSKGEPWRPTRIMKSIKRGLSEPRNAACPPHATARTLELLLWSRYYTQLQVLASTRIHGIPWVNLQCQDQMTLSLAQCDSGTPLFTPESRKPQRNSLTTPTTQPPAISFSWKSAQKLNSVRWNKATKTKNSGLSVTATLIGNPQATTKESHVHIDRYVDRDRDRDKDGDRDKIFRHLDI